MQPSTENNMFANKVFNIFLFLHCGTSTMVSIYIISHILFFV